MDSIKPYPHTVDYAIEHGEIEAFGEDSQINRACVNAIDEAIKANHHDMYYYNVGAAADAVVKEYGIDRVNWCMAGLIREHDSDGRYSRANKDWAHWFDVPRNKYSDFVFQTHPTVLDSFADSVRKIHREMMLEAVGLHEDNHHVAARNRLTVFPNGTLSFRLREGVTDRRLYERYSEIMEKKSVLAQIRAARKEQKQQSAPKPERMKNKSGPEL